MYDDTRQVYVIDPDRTQPLHLDGEVPRLSSPPVQRDLTIDELKQLSLM